MKEIGGYFELELRRQSHFLHDDGILLNCCRGALEYIFRANDSISKIWIPFFTCDVVKEPIGKLNIPIEYYRINENLEIVEDIRLKEDEFLLYTNYFGIKDQYVSYLSSKYGNQLIVDCAQAWYAPPFGNSNYAYSPRKFLGIPDGGVAYCTKQLTLEGYPIDVSYDRFSHLLKRIDLTPSEGYKDFRDNAHKLNGQGIKKMSNLTKSLLQSIDYDAICEKRKGNFSLIHSELGALNRLKMPSIDTYACPMTYPLWYNKEGLKDYLIKNKIYVATYWPNVLSEMDKNTLEYDLVSNLVHIPIDQRYDNSDMMKIVKLIKEWM